MKRKHTGVAAILLAALVLTGCSPSAGLPAGQTSPPPAAAAQPQPAAEPLAVSVSPERSCYQQLYDQPEDPNWALYAEITVTNQTDEPLSIETIYLYPNHQFYGEAASTPYLLPEAATVALRETGLWEIHADQISLDSCPVRETWPFGENQLEFPLELAAGQSQTGNIYIPGGTDMTTGLPMAPYTLDLVTSVGDFSYYGMAIAPNGNTWGTFKPSAANIDDIRAAESVSRFLEDSRLLLWLTPSAFVDMDNGNPLQSNEEIYRAVSAVMLYLTAQGQIEPLAYRSGVPYYSQQAFEQVLFEMFGQRWDCTSLLQPVQIEKQNEAAIPAQYTLTDVACRATVISQQDHLPPDGGTPETALDQMKETTISLTYYAPSAAQSGTTLSIPGDRPYKIIIGSNSSWEYVPFCFLGIEQLL